MTLYVINLHKEIGYYYLGRSPQDFLLPEGSEVTLEYGGLQWNTLSDSCMTAQ